MNPKHKRLHALLRREFGGQLPPSADWVDGAWRVAGVLTGWFLAFDAETRSFLLGYRDPGSGLGFEVEREFGPLELLCWLRSPAGLAAFRQVVGASIYCPSGVR